MIISPIIYEDYNSIIGHILFKNVLTIYFDNNFGSGVVKYSDDELKQTVENFCLKIFNRTYGFKTLQKNQCSINISTVNINKYNQIYKNHLVEYIVSTCNKRYYHLKYFKGKLLNQHLKYIEALYNDRYQYICIDRIIINSKSHFYIFLKSPISYNEYIKG